MLAAALTHPAGCLMLAIAAAPPAAVVAVGLGFPRHRQTCCCLRCYCQTPDSVPAWQTVWTCMHAGNRHAWNCITLACISSNCRGPPSPLLTCTRWLPVHSTPTRFARQQFHPEPGCGVVQGL